MEDSDWIEVGDWVFARRYAFLDQQIGLVLGDGAALVVDTRSSPRHARDLQADIARITPFPVTTVVSTHWHWDHVFGNHEFRPATIWGHERCRTTMLADGEAERAWVINEMPEIAEDVRDMDIDPPNAVFEDAVTIEVGGRPIDLRYLGRGHTDADIVVLVPDSDVLFTGDLLENDAVPWFGDGFPMDWPRTIERLQELVRGSVVPGHGSIGDMAFVERQLAEFRSVAETARRVHAGELGRDAALGLVPYGSDAAAGPIDRALAQLRGDLD
ncbi:MAG: MBL fold metallo-hydrolase [Chloroflexota bacterium]